MFTRRRTLPAGALAGLEGDEARIVKAIFDLQRLDPYMPISYYEIGAMSLLHESAARRLVERLADRGVLRRSRYNGPARAGLFYYEVLNTQSSESGTICPK